MTREGKLRRRCRRLLRELDIRPPLDTPELCRRLAVHRGRPIKLVAYPIEAPGPFGLCVMTESMDVIFYQQETTRAHQDHIILHEVGHMIAGHGGEQAWPPEDLTGAGPGGPALWLQRTCYDSAHEREAELIATIILERAALLDPADTLGPVPPPEDHALTRIRRALTHQSNWL